MNKLTRSFEKDDYELSAWAYEQGTAAAHLEVAQKLVALMGNTLATSTGGYMSTPIPIEMARTHAAIALALSA